jgi:hypothetical protein
VAYPGYAPTGRMAPASDDPSSGPVPLAAVAGGILLATGATLTVSRVRSRAARQGG